jgi:biopolymer transport protein ExbD
MMEYRYIFLFSVSIIVFIAIVFMRIYWTVSDKYYGHVAASKMIFEFAKFLIKLSLLFAILVIPFWAIGIMIDSSYTDNEIILIFISFIILCLLLIIILICVHNIKYSKDLFINVFYMFLWFAIVLMAIYLSAIISKYTSDRLFPIIAFYVIPILFSYYFYFRKRNEKQMNNKDILPIIGITLVIIIATSLIPKYINKAENVRLEKATSTFSRVGKTNGEDSLINVEVDSNISDIVPDIIKELNEKEIFESNLTQNKSNYSKLKINGIYTGIHEQHHNQVYVPKVDKLSGYDKNEIIKYQLSMNAESDRKNRVAMKRIDRQLNKLSQDLDRVDESRKYYEDVIDLLYKTLREKGYTHAEAIEIIRNS